MNKLKPNLNLINRLVKESFGKQFNANRDYDVDWETGDAEVEKTNYAKDIVKKSLFGFLVFYAGEFQKSDGSKIEVFDSYEKNAIKYASLYEAATGKKVSIFVKP